MHKINSTQHDHPHPFHDLGILVVLHLIVAFYILCSDKGGSLTQLVSDLESNLPTFCNISLFFIGAGLFYVHGKAAIANKRSGWCLMAAIFVFLGIDEGSQIHEKFVFFTHRLLGHEGKSAIELGWFYYALVIPYGLAAIGLLVLLSRWLLNLDPKLRRGLLISGAIYVFGAVFLEMAGGKVVGSDSYPAEDFPWLPCRIMTTPRAAGNT